MFFNIWPFLLAGLIFWISQSFVSMNFGERVEPWATVNEPWTFSEGGYHTGSLAPGRGSAGRNKYCPAGSSATEPYLVAHNILLSHGGIAKLYWEKYKVRTP